MVYTQSRKDSLIKVSVVSKWDAYIRQWNNSSLDQVMVCRLCSAKPLPEQILDKAFEKVVYKIADILFRPQCVKMAIDRIVLVPWYKASSASMS